MKENSPLFSQITKNSHPSICQKISHQSNIPKNFITNNIYVNHKPATFTVPNLLNENHLPNVHANIYSQNVLFRKIFCFSQKYFHIRFIQRVYETKKSSKSMQPNNKSYGELFVGKNRSRTNRGVGWCCGKRFSGGGKIWKNEIGVEILRSKGLPEWSNQRNFDLKNCYWCDIKIIYAKIQ